jgi:hypothetical protein
LFGIAGPASAAVTAIKTTKSEYKMRFQDI